MAHDIAVFEHAFDPITEHLTQALPPSITLTAPRLIRTILVSLERNPALQDCTRQSLFNAAMSAACLGLECDGVTGQAFLIPFAGKAQLVIGYKGFNTLAARSGISISGEVVRDGDMFDFDLGEGWIKHKKQLGVPQARTIAAWAKAAANDRPAVVKVMDINELMAVKSRSPGARKADSPWNDPAIGFAAMSEKTVKRRLARVLPLNVMQAAARMDEAFEEQGIAGHITPREGLILEGQAEPPTATELTKTEPTQSEILAAYSMRLQQAPDHDALQRTYTEIPEPFHTILESAFRRHMKGLAP